MDIKDKVVIVTGGASGIGLALCQRFAQEGAQVVLSDLHQDAADSQAAPIGATAVAANVGSEADIANLVDVTLTRFGRIDMFCSNAGIAIDGGEQVEADKWKLIYDVNLLAHVYAAKYALPGMLERGSGYLMSTASAAGLLTEFHAAPYAVTKHAAIGWAEWLSITYGPRGIAVSVLCPAAVLTPIIANEPSLIKTAITTDELADDVMAAIAEERFMISTHPFVLELFKVKGNDYEQYIEIMRQQRAEYLSVDQAAA